LWVFVWVFFFLKIEFKEEQFPVCVDDVMHGSTAALEHIGLTEGKRLATKSCGIFPTFGYLIPTEE